jgi:hypothetical protein
MKILRSSEMDIPSVEPFILVVILTLAILLRYPRFGLLAAYLFAYKWCWSLVMGLSLQAQIAYTFFGVLVGLFAVVGLMQDRSEA